MKTIVISAVNIRKGGTLTILRDCLAYLSKIAERGDYRVVALVHKRSLALYNHIEYIEMPHTIEGWGKRLWCEYVTMYEVSQKLQPIHLWLSLHDTTPRVIAERKAVYCQTSFPFLRLRAKDILFDYKVVLFALFTKFAYKVNVRQNKWLIVQAGWLRARLSKMLQFPEDRIIVAPPPRQDVRLSNLDSPQNSLNCCTFIYPATPDCHKNFELLCRAAQLLEDKIGNARFKVLLTISGKENRYAHWLQKTWGTLKSIDFKGFMSRDQLYDAYAHADCLVFPSRVETWGLPVSEFAVFKKPMLLADLPYAHETAAGCEKVSFFDTDNPHDLARQMLWIVEKETSNMRRIPLPTIQRPYAQTWEDLFTLLTR